MILSPAVRRFSILLGLLYALPAAGDPGGVVVSLRPLHSLVSGLMTGIEPPELLFKRAESPHVLVMRPSQRRVLDAAGLVIRVGPALEVAMNRTIKALDDDIKVLNILDAPGLEYPPARTAGSWITNFNPHNHRNQSNADGPRDPHVLLSPANGIAISRYVTEALVAHYPEHAAQLEKNLNDQLQRIELLDAELTLQLKSIANVPYLVFHDAYHVFEDHYGLGSVGAVTVAPGRAPSAKRLQTLIRTIEETKAQCLFTEPQFEPASAKRIAESAGVRLGVLDPVGSTIEPGSDHWFTLMRNLASNLTECLRKPEG